MGAFPRFAASQVGRLRPGLLLLVTGLFALGLAACGGGGGGGGNGTGGFTVGGTLSGLDMGAYELESITGGCGG